jgi:succinyl-CoA synthetase beta subunit
LINVFGGILRCDVFAQGVIQAVSKVQVNLPVIVRMAGTNVEEGQRLLTESGLKFFVADNLADTADKVMQALRT